MGKYTYEQVKQICDENGFVLVSEEYVNSKKPLKMVCKECGYERTTRLSRILEGYGCRGCKGCRKFAIEEIREALEEKNIILMEEIYHYNTAPINVKCMICNFIWSGRFTNIRGGSGCPNCSGKRKYTIEEVRELVEEKNGTLLTKEYQGVFAKLEVICNNCNLSWNPSFKSIMAGHWCPTCADYGNRKTQSLLAEIFGKLFPNIKIFQDFYGFEWLKYGKRRQEIDIWVPDLKLAVEYDGGQHFKAVDYFGGREGLIKQKKRDLNKNKLISKHRKEVKYFIRFNYKDRISEELIRSVLNKYDIPI